MASEQKAGSWWHTLPGILTATAAVITAVTGLVVALFQLGALTRGPERPLQTAGGVPASSQSARGAGTPVQHPSPQPEGLAGRQALALPTPAEFRAREVVYRILSIELVPYSSENRALHLSVRMTNLGRYDEPLGYDRSRFRLLVEDVPRAPITEPVVRVAGESAGEGEFVFLVPTTAERVVLQARHGEEVTRIPIDLPANR